MPDATAEVSPRAKEAAGRAGRNTAVRAAADLIGKFASLALIFALARATGPEGLGVYVFAFAWAELALTPVAMGFDRYLVRRVAEEPGELDPLFGSIVWVKLVRAVPVLAASTALVALLGYDATHIQAVVFVSVGLLFDSLVWTVLSVFTAHERGGLSATTVVAQRILAAALGLAALAAGLGVLAVTLGYVAGTAAALAVGVVLMRRRVARPAFVRRSGARERVSRHVYGFAAQELLSVGIARVDTLLLSLMASTAVVGTYGASYRLLEATLFIPVAIAASCSAMFTYLQLDGDPPVHAAFQRAIKLALALLVPAALVLLILAGPVIELLFGDGFAAAEGPLRLLAPVVGLLGVVIISNTLVVGRRDPTITAYAFGGALILNVVLNLVLIPPYGASGAAAAMLVTYLLFSAVVFAIAVRTVGGIDTGATLLAPFAAGATMALVLLALRSVPLAAVPAAAAAYAAVWALVDRWASPADLAFVLGVVRRRLPARAAR